MLKETPIETLNYYALTSSKLMHRPLDDTQRAALVSRVHRILPDTALKELRSEWAMKLALAVTFEALADPRLPAGAPRQMPHAAADPS